MAPTNGATGARERRQFFQMKPASDGQWIGMRPSRETEAEVRGVSRGRFEAIYREHHAFVWRCARQMGASDASVDDAVQETFVIALRRLDEYDPARAAVSTWLFGILRNVLFNQNRGRRRRARRGAEYASAHAVEEGLGAERELARTLLREFLDGLDEERRAVFVLADIEGFAAKEIAAALSCNVNTVYTRLRWVRARFERHVDRAPLLLRARHEQPSAEVQARNWAGISALAGLELAPAAAGTSAGFAWLGLLTKLGAGLLAALVGMLVLGGGLSSPRTEVGAEKAPALRGSATRPTKRQAEHVEAPAPIVVNPLPRQAEVPAGRGGGAPDATLAEAFARLEQATAQIDAGEHEAALAVLERGPWPTPALSGRARVLEVELQCRLGRDEQARARARAWLRHHPDGVAAEQLRRSCAGVELR